MLGLHRLWASPPTHLLSHSERASPSMWCARHLDRWCNWRQTQRASSPGLLLPQPSPLSHQGNLRLVSPRTAQEQGRPERALHTGALRQTWWLQLWEGLPSQLHCSDPALRRLMRDVESHTAEFSEGGPRWDSTSNLDREWYLWLGLQAGLNLSLRMILTVTNEQTKTKRPSSLCYTWTTKKKEVSLLAVYRGWLEVVWWAVRQEGNRVRIGPHPQQLPTLPGSSRRQHRPCGGAPRAGLGLGVPGSITTQRRRRARNKGQRSPQEAQKLTPWVDWEYLRFPEYLEEFPFPLSGRGLDGDCDYIKPCACNARGMQF